MLCTLGFAYFLLMFGRFLIGILGLSEFSWFQKPIPALFHLVLASFMIMLGMYHLRNHK